MRETSADTAITDLCEYACRRRPRSPAPWRPLAILPASRRERARHPPRRRTSPRRGAAAGPLQEIVVTATRHEESLSKVPISVTAPDPDEMDVRGIKDILDVARFTPGINVDNSGTNNISIRGIASTGGAGTTGIYSTTRRSRCARWPSIPTRRCRKSFDLDRVEVLRGPQGTLFGAGSEGGTVRYITTQPSLTKTSVYSRDEISYTQGGAPSYEAGVAGRHAAHRRHARRPRHRLVPLRRRLDRSASNPRPLNSSRRKNAELHPDQAVPRSRVCGRRRMTGRSRRAIYLPGSIRERPCRTTGRSTPIPATTGTSAATPPSAPMPDTFYIPALKVEGDFGAVQV